MKLTCPLLVTRDLTSARAFYEQVMGQTVVMDFGSNITFDGGFALQALESWADFLKTSPEAIHFGGKDTELYFETEAFDGFLSHLNAFSSVQIVHPPKEHDWGQHVIRIYDPDLHILEIGESMRSVVRRFLLRGFTPEETAQKTQHPLSFILSCQADMEQATSEPSTR